ncbi:hypothetical protein V1517DRAFT_324490 [Lipomyces orientalis]|uniref:Uncharacterized protein n=1 Tax=Lipomyces orientalis TaxID=1233043 RepID=A0ACC3TLJ4_9ASCO
MEVSKATTRLQSQSPATDAVISLALDGIAHLATAIATKTDRPPVSVAEKLGLEIEKIGTLAIANVNTLPPEGEFEISKGFATKVVQIRPETAHGSPADVLEGKLGDNTDGNSKVDPSTASTSASLKRKHAQTMFSIVKHRRRTGISPRRPTHQCPTRAPIESRAPESLKRKREFELEESSSQGQPLKRRAGSEQWLVVHLQGNTNTNKSPTLERKSRAIGAQRNRYLSAGGQNAGSDADDESSEYETSPSPVKSTSGDKNDGTAVNGKSSAGRVLAIPVFDATQTKLDTTNIAELVPPVVAVRSTTPNGAAPVTTVVDPNESARGVSPDNTKKGRKLADMLLSMDILTTPELTTTSSSSGTESGSSPDGSPAHKVAEHCGINDVEEVSPPPAYTSPPGDYLKTNIGVAVNDNAIVREDSPRTVISGLSANKTQCIASAEQLFYPSPSIFKSSTQAITGNILSPLTEAFQRLQLDCNTIDTDGNEELLEYTDTEVMVTFPVRFRPATVHVKEGPDGDSAILF